MSSTTKKGKQPPAKSAGKKGGFTAEEKAAMRARARELKDKTDGETAVRRAIAAMAPKDRAIAKQVHELVKAAADGETAVREALAAMTSADRALGQRVHAIVKEAAPELVPKTWYGMPAYANEDGKVVFFFRNATKFKERYAMIGFNDTAQLDQGSMWPVAFALTKLTAADEKKIRAMVKKAVS